MHLIEDYIYFAQQVSEVIPPPSVPEVDFCPRFVKVKVLQLSVAMAFTGAACSVKDEAVTALNVIL